MPRDGSIRRFVTAIFDRPSAQKMEAEFEHSLGRAAERGGKTFIRELRQEFDKSMGQLRKQLADGVINEAEFKKRAQSLARAFNTTLSKEMDKAAAAGTLTDKEFVKLSRTFKSVESSGTTAFGRIKASVTALANTGLGPLLAAGGIFAALRRANEEANALDAAERTLASTAKITGVNFDFLSASAQRANDKFGFGVQLANSFTIEMAKLTAKAGDLRNLSVALESFLDIGAARGLDANQTLKAIQQSILGIDEGTDKLFGKNPSVLYKEYADRVGESATKLTDQQKAIALVDAAIRDGEKVRGEYQKWLTTSAGQQFLLNVEIQKTYAALGKALQPALVAILPVVTLLTKAFTGLISVIQRFGELLSGALFSFFGSITAVLVTLVDAAEGAVRGFAKVAEFLGARKTAQGLEQTANALDRVAQSLRNVRDAEFETAAESFGAAFRFGKPKPGMPGVVTPPTGTPTPKTAEEIEAERKAREKAFDDEIAALKAVAEARAITADEIDRARQLEAQLTAEIEKGIKSAERRAQQIGRRDTLRGITEQFAPQTGIVEEQGLAGVKRSGIAAELGVRKGLLEPIVAESESAAADFVSPWEAAFVRIGEEVESSRGLIGELAEAWAEGGFAGVAALAKAKIKENIARAIEEAAKAVGALALGNPASAAAHGKAAAGASAAAAAWGVAAGAAGGGGGAAGGASFPTTGATNTRNAATASKSAEIHINLIGPGFDAVNPRVQDVVMGAVQEAQERYGPNATVRINRRRT